MARLNTSKSTAVYGRQSPTTTKTQPRSFHRTTISSPLRPMKETKKSSGFAEFKIFEDEELPADENAGDPFIEPPSKTTQKRPMAPLKLTHTNSITSGLSSCGPQERSVSSSSRSRSGSDFDEEESSDKENIFFDDEAEEASEESDEGEGNEEEDEEGEENTRLRDLNDLDGQSNLAGDMDRQESPQGSRFTQYRESKVKDQSDESQSEESEDGYSSLDDFIVSDNEDLSYYESEDGLDEEDEEVKPPTPKPTRRRLLRGRKPRNSNISAQTKSLSVSTQDSSPDLADSVTHNSPTRQTPPRLTTSFTRLSPNKTHLEEVEVTKEKLAKRSPLRESINSVSSTPETTRRKQQERKMQTPPESPSKIKFPSPSRSSQRIPPSPHRQSSDAFWSQDITDAWNDQWSPPKQRTKSRALERLLSALGEESNEVDEHTGTERAKSNTIKNTAVKSPSKSPSKTALKKAEVAQRKEAAARKKAFDDKKMALAQDFLTALDEATSGGEISRLAESTGGIKVVWSKTLRSTAGRAKWKQERTKQPGKDIKCIHHASIELAEHVIDDEDRLLNTLAHEYCHLANYMISGIRNQPHGASFKQWGRKCVDAIKTHPEYMNYPIEVTTKHSYQIDYKYVWICTDCGYKYGRHSKSIDPTKSRCSLCTGGLQQVKPKPRQASPKKKGTIIDMSQDSSSFLNSGNTLNESLDNMVESLGNANLD